MSLQFCRYHYSASGSFYGRQFASSALLLIFPSVHMSTVSHFFIKFPSRVYLRCFFARSPWSFFFFSPQYLCRCRAADRFVYSTYFARRLHPLRGQSRIVKAVAFETASLKTMFVGASGSNDSNYRTETAAQQALLVVPSATFSCIFPFQWQ